MAHARRKAAVIRIAVGFIFALRSGALIAAEFRGNPYLCTPNWSESDGGEMTVCWKSDVDKVGEVTYGPAGSPPLAAVKPEGSNQVTRGEEAYRGFRMWVRLKKLQAGTTYSYRVSGNGINGGKEGEFYVPKKDDPVLILLVGDRGVDKGENGLPSAKDIEFIEKQAGKKVDLLVDVGDTRQHRWMYRFTAPAQLSRIPYCVALGNHEADKGVASPWEHFDLPNKGYYTVRWGVVWLALYAWAQSPGSQYYGFRRGKQYTELDWLKKAVAQAPPDAPWRCLAQHQPVFCSFHRKPMGSLPEEIWPTLRQHNVSFVFSGHIHHFFRSYPIADASGTLPAGFTPDPSAQFDAGKGTTQLVVCGGTRTSKEKVIPPWEAFVNTERAHGPVYILFKKGKGQGEFLRTRCVRAYHKFTFTLGGDAKK